MGERDMSKEDKISRNEFQKLRDEFKEVKTAFIGIDGKSGFSGDLQELKSDVKSLSKTVQDLTTSLNIFKDVQLNNHKLFASKEEVNNLEHTILMKLNEFDRKRDEARRIDKEEREKKDKEEKLFELKKTGINLSKSDLVIAKISLVIAVLGITIAAVFSSISFIVR